MQRLYDKLTYQYYARVNRDPDAYVKLGDIALEEDKPGKAKNCYTTAAVAYGNKEAYEKLADLYVQGLGVTTDYQKAANYYECAVINPNETDKVFNKLLHLCYKHKVTCGHKMMAEILKVLSAQGHISAQIKLGNLYVQGLGVIQNFQLAAEQYEKAALQGDDIAFEKLADLYFKQKITCNNKLHLAIFKWGADKEIAEGQLKLGDLYAEGQSLPLNHHQAAHYYLLAANQGNHEAQLKLANLYFQGLGGIKDLEQASVLYWLLAKRKNKLAQEKLIDLYFIHSVDCQEMMITKIFSWAIAKKNDAEIQLKLADCYMQGRGVKKDYLEAKKYYRSAARKGKIEALIKLGNLYVQGGVGIDYAKAAKCYQLAIAQGNALAHRLLADLYLRNVDQEMPAKEKMHFALAKFDPGEIVLLSKLLEKQDPAHLCPQKLKDIDPTNVSYKTIPFTEEEISTIKKLIGEAMFHMADQNIFPYAYQFANAQHNLASKLSFTRKNCSTAILERYLGINQSNNIYHEAAAKLYQQAFAKGDIISRSRLTNLGMFYLKKRKDATGAFQYLKTAADLGDARAQTKLADFYVKGIGGVNRNFQEARKYLDLASRQRYAKARGKLADLHLHGRGVEKDSQEAARLYQLAESQGNVKSRQKLKSLLDIQMEEAKAAENVEQIKIIAAQQRRITIHELESHYAENKARTLAYASFFGVFSKDDKDEALALFLHYIKGSNDVKMYDFEDKHIDALYDGKTWDLISQLPEKDIAFLRQDKDVFARAADWADRFSKRHCMSL